MPVQPQCYFLCPNDRAPNNRLPVLHYRNVLPRPHTEESVTKFLEANRWEKRGAWGHIAIRHFHPNSHECYGIYSGSSTLLLGQLSDDEDQDANANGIGMKVDVEAGDVIILPAGTAHSSLQSSADYRYIGVYPEGCSRWTNEMGDNPPETFFATIEAVGMPQADPVHGVDGPLMSLWRDTMKERSKL